MECQVGSYSPNVYISCYYCRDRVYHGNPCYYCPPCNVNFCSTEKCQDEHAYACTLRKLAGQ